MPALAPLVVNDREDTPVAHTFNPNGNVSNVYSFIESDGTPIGDNKVTVSHRRMVDGRYKTRVVLSMPITVDETINGVVRQNVERSSFVELQTTFAGDSTEQERENAVGLMANLMSASQTVLNPVLTKLESLY